VLGMAFAIVQLRQLRVQRKEHAAVEAMRSFQSPDFKRASWIVLALPEQATEEQIDTAGARDAIHDVILAYEAMGVMVFHRQLPMRIVDDLTGGFIRASWRRLQPHVVHVRAHQGFNNYAEWFQWLADRLHEHPAPGKDEGAFAHHVGWRP
jgi:hypothetical protein